ncbi:MAG: hypothetical protein E6J55_08530 [Deltaproteobacteria bacterium]|nr:MAG: hypothetical protein E6J55_08530 [Deltaproteobacteria bacterium]
MKSALPSPPGVEAAAPAIRSPRNASWRTPACLLVATFVAVGGASPSRATSLPGGGPAATDCYVVLNAQGTALAARPNRLECKDGDPQCDQDGDCHNGSCKFRVRVCIDQDGCQAPSALRSLQIGPAKLAIPRPTTLSGAACGDFADVPVSLKGKGKTRPGKQVIVLKARAQGAKSTDIDKDTLVCLPRPASEPCPTTTTSTLPPIVVPTTSTSTSTTSTSATTSTIVTTTTMLGGTSTTTTTLCPPLVVGQPIPNTYRLNGTTGEKRCTTNSASNRFGLCSTDADCGGTAGACMTLPWVTADGQVMPFSTGTQTTFTVATEGAAPMCEHNLCIPCGNPNASCAGIPGCEVADNPNGCVPRGTQGCCDQPAFIVPTFFVNILGGLCSRVDQIGCGGGVVNTSNPQSGHNKVTKNGDTSDPGADCCYNGHPASECLNNTNLNDDPTLAAQGGCSVNGAGVDYKGKIVKAIGGGATDAPGIHFRYTVPELSTTWTDGQSPPGTCANGSTYDDGELLVSQLILKADTTTSGATGSFTDLNGDGCKRAGAGFISASNAATDGPITVPGAESGGPARPQAYEGSTGSVAAAVSEVFSGPNSPIRDIGFVAITPQNAAVVVPALSCSCTVQPDCPE